MASVDTTDLHHRQPYPSGEKALLESHTLDGKTVQSRSWRTNIIRFGPLSGIVGMLVAIASLVASLGIIVGSDGQPVLAWPTPPSTYLAIFTALANLSLRYAAVQGIVIAWWCRAMTGSTLAKLHWDWRAGTTLRGAVTSGRHMGILGLACVFSTAVVIDGPLLQRSSTVALAPISNRPLPLNISIAPQIPHDFSGRWAVWEGLTNAAFNDTVPTNNGPASNHIMAYPDGNVTRELTESWLSDAPLAGVVQGCPDSSTCRVKIQAPTLFPTCSTHSTPLALDQTYNWRASLADERAPPLSSLVFAIGLNLLISHGREAINLITASSDASDCNGTLFYTICTLESGVGEYTVEIENNEILMRNLQTPTLLALSNNTAVDYSEDLVAGFHPSTLASLTYLCWSRWYSRLYWSIHNNHTEFTFSSTLPWTLIVKPGTTETKCSSYLDLTEKVLSSLNKLAVYSGAHAASQHITPDRMDPGISLKTTTTGHVVGRESEYETDYHFFLAAAIVEITCIALIAPTYWGWWRLGRSVSFSPLEIAKAFEAPMLSGYNSNSSGRDLAKVVDDFHVQYGVTSNSATQRTKLAISASAAVTMPQNGSRFSN